MDDRVAKYLKDKERAKEERAKKAELDKQRAAEIQNMKLSHDWHSVINYGTSTLNSGTGPITSMRRVLGSCKRCGLHYMIFKGRPAPCINQAEKEAEK